MPAVAASGSGPIRLEILYFDGCPHHETLVARLPQLLAGEVVPVEVVLRNVPDDECAQRERFLGSPTVRVNGRDIDPGAAARRDFGLKCRLYPTAGGLGGSPPDRWILDAIAARRDR